ncbi:MAG TPA: FAD-linked oxidase C-terminal domain-containing protein [Micromonosporaceae bacterium]
MDAAFPARLADLIGAAKVITDRQELRTYECDGLAHYRCTPEVAVLATSADDIAAVVRECRAAGVPFVARGSGTGLSGGALPVAGGVLIVTAKLRTVHEIDAANQRAVVDPGVINLQVTRDASPYGYYYAPDPSSQQVCSVGGNVAENSGGAHCLKYGFTTNHVTGLQVVTPDGDVVALGGGKTPDAPGYDLMGVFVGSEGTLGIATEVTVRLTRAPEAVVTMLAGFATTDQAGAAVSGVIAAGVLPAAMEIMDALAIEAAEAAVACGYPEGAGAVLIVELDGPAAEVEHLTPRIEQMCREHGAFEVRIASSADERARIWTGRKSAFAAVGRISPDYIVQDGVIPRTALPDVLRQIDELSQRNGIRVANVFHAGDGNLHPLVLFDDAIEGAAERAEEVSAEILRICVRLGGSITGEHGVGEEKKAYMPEMYSPDDLDTMQMVRCAFDPATLSNPGKVFPTPRLCGEPPRPRRGEHPLQAAGVGELF